MGEKNELLNVQIQYKLIEELKIANQKLQKQIEKEISLKKEIKKINSELEKNIAEQSKKNIELSNSLHQNEAMASIGEISSGIAHDLNTPLGAIKTSAESIRFTLKDFFTNDLGNVSPEEFDIAYKRVMNTDSIKIFLNSSIQKINAAKFNSYLEEKHPEIKNKNQLSILFVNARIGLEETKMIHLVLESKNPISFLRLIDHFQKVHSFIDTILHSSDRAGKVIRELSGVVKKQKNKFKEKINLKENISSLVNMFKYEIKKDINVSIKVDQSLNIIGHESQLFQLWANLFKNAIFAVNERIENKKIQIFSVDKKNEIDIVFMNNGPAIEPEIQKLIFNKFFTTKKKEGTGLGLGIVKNVVESHQAKIRLHSDKRKTCFIITFAKNVSDSFYLN